MHSVSVVVPVYNAALTLRKLCEQLATALEEITESFEVILVDDGSRDESWSVIHELVQQDQRLHGIRLGRNYGQHNALLCGIRAAGYEVILTVDDDLQHPVSEIPLLLDKLAEGYDIVYGTPQQQQHGLLRNLASRLTKLALQSAMGVETARNVSAFRVFRTRVRDAFESYSGPYVSIDVLLTWGTTRFSSVPVRHDPRRAGQSNYTLGKLVVHALNMLTGFSTVPLQLASLAGFAFTLFGIGVLIYVVGRYFIDGGSIPGFPFLASLIAIFSGAQLFALGVLGEYMARIHFRTMDRPAYVVGEHSGRLSEKIILTDLSTEPDREGGHETDGF